MGGGLIKTEGTPVEKEDQGGGRKEERRDTREQN